MANLGFTAVATVNGVVAGLGVHAGLTFLLVLHLDMGVRGAALASSTSRANASVVLVPSVSEPPNVAAAAAARLLRSRSLAAAAVGAST